MRCIASLLVAMSLFAGCIGTEPSPPTGSTDSVAPGGGIAIAKETWYPVAAEDLQLRLEPLDETTAGGEIPANPAEWSEQGPFVAVNRSEGFPVGTAVTLTIPYSCGHPASMEFRFQLLAGGEMLAAAEGVHLYVGTVVQGLPSAPMVQWVTLNATLEKAVPRDAFLELVFAAKGCSAFFWGRGGEWATELVLGSAPA